MEATEGDIGIADPRIDQTDEQEIIFSMREYLHDNSDFLELVDKIWFEHGLFNSVQFRAGAAGLIMGWNNCMHADYTFFRCKPAYFAMPASCQ